MSTYQNYHNCPTCRTPSPIITDLEGPPKLSPSGTYIYYCPKCQERFWEGMSLASLDSEGDIQLNALLNKQFTGLYGDFSQGEYKVGDWVTSRDTSGMVIWSFRGTDGTLCYVVEENGWPQVLKASDVQAWAR